MTEEQYIATYKAFMRMADATGLEPGVKLPVDVAAKQNSETILSMTPEQQKAALYSVYDLLFDMINASKDGYISMKEFKVYFHAMLLLWTFTILVYCCRSRGDKHTFIILCGMW